MLTNLREKNQVEFLAKRVKEAPSGIIALTHVPEIFSEEKVDCPGCEVMSTSEDLINDLIEQAPFILKSETEKYIVYPCLAGCAVEVSRYKHYI